MKDGKELFKQMEKVTALGVLVVVFVVVLAGLVLQEGLSNGFQSSERELGCGTNMNKESSTSMANSNNGDVQTGKTLFLEKCASCHNIDMTSDMTGPALYGAVDRWGNRADLYQWVQDYSVLVEQGHPRALQMQGWSPSEMTTFTNLDTNKIRKIFAFIEGS